MGNSGASHHSARARAPPSPPPPPPPPPRALPELVDDRGAGLDTPPPLILLADEDARRFLVDALPARACRAPWRLLFASALHGRSFSRFAHCVYCGGPNVVIVRERGGGAVFGGFCDTWRGRRPRFFGTPSSFVFTLAPARSVFRVTGRNDHYQYLNWGTETQYNGVGMGGQSGFFAWCIDEDFERGHCRGTPSSTFGCPLLAGEGNEDWLVDAVEVWGVCAPDLDPWEEEEMRARQAKPRAAGGGGSASVARDEDNPDKVIKGYTHEFSGFRAGDRVTRGADGDVLLI